MYPTAEPYVTSAVRLRVGAVVHGVYWNLHYHPLGSNAPKGACYVSAFPPCISSPIMARNVHPTDAPMTCFWCVAGVRA